MEGCRDLFTKQSEAIESRFAPLEASVSDLQQKTTSLQREHDEMVARVSAMETSMAMADRQPSQIAALLDEENFVRDPILSRLKVNAGEDVTNASVKAAVSKWLGDASMQETCWTFSGPALGRYFAVDFSGDPVTGARRARKANLALRKPDGDWRNLVVQNVAGAEVSLYIGPDKSPQQEAQETLGKRLLRVVADLHPEVRFTFDKKKSLIKANKKDFAVLVASSRDERAPKFWIPTLEDLGISKDTILERLDSGARGHFNPDDANWSF